MSLIGELLKAFRCAPRLIRGCGSSETSHSHSPLGIWGHQDRPPNHRALTSLTVRVEHLSGRRLCSARWSPYLLACECCRMKGHIWKGQGGGGNGRSVGSVRVKRVQGRCLREPSQGGDRLSSLKKKRTRLDRAAQGVLTLPGPPPKAELYLRFAVTLEVSYGSPRSRSDGAPVSLRLT